MNFRHLWAMFSSFSKWITSFRGKVCSSSGEPFQELIVDALLHKNTRTGYTRLTFIIIEYQVGPSIDRKHTHIGTNLKKKNNQGRVKIYKPKHIQDSNGSPLRSLFKVSVVKHHTRTLSAQFQWYDLQIGLWRGFQNFATSESASSKGDLLNKGVFADSLPNGVALIDK